MKKILLVVLMTILCACEPVEVNEENNTSSLNEVESVQENENSHLNEIVDNGDTEESTASNDTTSQKKNKSKPARGVNYRVIGDRVNVRKGPGLNYNIAGIVEEGYLFKGQFTINNNTLWMKFEYEGTEAYLAAEFCKEVMGYDIDMPDTEVVAYYYAVDKSFYDSPSKNADYEVLHLEEYKFPITETFIDDHKIIWYKVKVDDGDFRWIIGTDVEEALEKIKVETP